MITGLMARKEAASMLEIVFIACLASAPAECYEERLTYFENLNPIACTIRAQGELAQWTNEHPNWRIARWGCRRADRGREIKA